MLFPRRSIYDARPRLLVLGDANADGAARVPRFPREGDDVPLDDLAWSSGGAGVNVATARVDPWAIRRDPERATGVCFIVVSPGAERTFLSYRGANAFLVPPPRSSWEGARRAHVCGHALLSGPQRDTVLAFSREAARRGLPTSLDLCLPLIDARRAGALTAAAAGSAGTLPSGDDVRALLQAPSTEPRA